MRKTNPVSIIIFLAVVALLAFLIVRLLATNVEVGETNATSTPSQETPKGKPVFSWSYAPYEENDIPKSKVSLTAKYPDGTVKTEQVDTIEGSCNEYENRDADVYKDSQMILCYYAGFGRYYKVVEQDGSVYLVRRREFEEASPDYNPPILDFVTIKEFR